MSAYGEDKVWSDILKGVEKRLNHQSFITWFEPVELVGRDEVNCILHLRAPNQIVRDWVTANYGDVIAASLSELHLTAYRIEWAPVEPEPAYSYPVPPTVITLPKK